MNEASGKTLSDLGKRLERLFYFGTLLLLACFFQLYFVSATTHGRQESPEDIAGLISKLEENSNHLNSLYKKSTASLHGEGAIDAGGKYLNIRRQLGLPQATARQERTEETYGEALSSIVDATSRRSAHKRISELVSSDKNPEVLLEELRSLQRELLKRSVSVWGIEAPPIIHLKYGEASYQVPTSFIAGALMVALAPLLIGWFGSVYMTRQRELLRLRDLRDYRSAFPHVLNVLPVVFTSVPRPIRFKNMRTQSINQLINRIMSSLVRSFILLLFLVPMWWIYTYSFFELVVPSASASWIEMMVAAFVVVCLFFQAALLVGQEWRFLWGKEYYA